MEINPQFTITQKKCLKYLFDNKTKEVLFGGAAGGGYNYVYRLKYDSQIVQEYVTNNNTDDAPNQKLNLIIPPFTNVECTAVNASDDSSNDQIVSLSGRTYA